MLRHIYIRLIFLPLSIFFLLFLTGCWNSKEIESLGLVLATAIDLEQKKEFSDEAVITITNQIVTSKTAGSGNKEGSSSKEGYENISETGTSIMGAIRDLVLKNEQRLFGSHMKVIVIGEELARTLNLHEVLDFFLREREIRPSALVLVAKNRADQILETEKSVIPARKLVQITKSTERNTKILPPLSLAKINEKIHSNSSFVMQTVTSDNGELRFEGATVIKGETKKVQGFLSEEELDGLAWLQGEAKGGIVESFIEETGNPLAYEIISMKRNITPHVKGDDISFDITVESTGRIGEHRVNVAKQEAFERKHLIRAEKAVEKEVYKKMGDVLEKTQQNFQVDVLGFGESLRIHYPKVWEKVKENWDEIFSELSIDYDINITIKDYGTTRE